MRTETAAKMNQLRMTEQQFADFNNKHSIVSPVKKLAPGQTPVGKMNKTEKRYAEILDAQKRAGLILWYEYESVTLKLAERTTYRPDFIVLVPNGAIEYHEVKGGFIREKAWLKLKIAAAKFPNVFRLAQFKDSQWNVRCVDGLYASYIKVAA